METWRREDVEICAVPYVLPLRYAWFSPPSPLLYFSTSLLLHFFTSSPPGTSNTSSAYAEYEALYFSLQQYSHS